MKNIFEKSCENAIKSTTLSAHDKATMRTEIIKFMEKNPVKKNSFLKIASLVNPFTLLSKPAPLFALLIVLSTGIGTSYASDTALPGDVLYPVKIYVNEGVRSLVVFTPESRAQWEVERASRRLEEASKLVALGTMDSQRRAGVESHFADSVVLVDKRIKDLTQAGNDDAAFEVSSRFESALRAHEEILNRLREREKAQNSEVENFIKNVDRQAEHARTIRVTFEVKGTKSNQAAVERKLAALQTDVTVGKAFIAAQSGSLSDKSQTRVQEALARVDAAISQAHSAIDANDVSRAFIQMQSAQRELTQAKMLARSLVDLSIDLPVRTGEQVVPRLIKERVDEKMRAPLKERGDSKDLKKRDRE